MPLVLVQPGVIKKNSAEYFAGMCSFFFFRNEETENFAPRRLVVSSHKYKYIKTKVFYRIYYETGKQRIYYNK